VARSLIDWRLAGRIAAAIGQAGGDNEAAAGSSAGDPFSSAAIAAACEDAVVRVLAYARLEPEADPPSPEALDRAAWAATALGTLRELGGELESKAAARLDSRGTLAGIGRSVLGAALATEAGAVAGYASRKVLGQYDISLFDEERPSRLLFVVPNLRVAQVQLDVDAPAFVHWVAVHEMTHAIQFSAVGWLREHLGGLAQALLRGAAARVESGAVSSAAAKLMRSDPRRFASALLRGELARAIAGPEQVALLDRLQATMAVIEGHAEHVMDAALSDLGGPYSILRERLEARRAQRSGLDVIVARLLGLELKLRQYRLGKAFCDAVVADGGVEELNRVWESPAALPDLAELEHPERWLARVPV
jgi:coenzyme F420 biosynthesis associated uncharacterized protein